MQREGVSALQKKSRLTQGVVDAAADCESVQQNLTKLSVKSSVNSYLLLSYLKNSTLFCEDNIIL